LAEVRGPQILIKATLQRNAGADRAQDLLDMLAQRGRQQADGIGVSENRATGRTVLKRLAA
jgi:hypothetical protein